jgi:streptogramin lyase
MAEIPLGDTPDDVVVGPDQHVWVTLPGSHRASPMPEGWLVEVDPASARVVSRIRVGRRPARVVWAADAVWVLNAHRGPGEVGPTVMRVDPVRREVTHVFAVAAADMAGDDSGIWLVDGGGDLWRIDPAAPGPPTLLQLRRGAGQYIGVTGIAVDARAVWILESRWTTGLVANVHKADRDTGRIEAVLPLDGYSEDIAAGLGSVWVASRQDARGGVGRTVSRFDPETGKREAIPVEPGPFSLAVCDDGVWVSNLDTVFRIDPATDRVAEVLDVPYISRRLACGSGAVWATRETRDARDGSLVRILRSGSGSGPPLD